VIRPKKTVVTKKTNLTILISGVMACVALSFMMSHLLSMRVDDKHIGPVVQRFNTRFRAVLGQDARFKVEGLKASKSPGAPLDVLVKVTPKPSTDVDAMIPRMGQFLWQGQYRRGLVSRVRIEIRDPVDKTTRTVEVPNPRLRGKGGSNRVRTRYKPLPRPKR